MEHYGEVEKNILHKGHDINIEFNGNLFPYQENIIQKYIDFVGNSGGGLLDVEPERKNSYGIKYYF